MVWLDNGGCGRDYARLLPPPPALAPWVEHFWIQQEPITIREGPWRIVADSCGHLVFSIESHPGRDRIRCLLVGARAVYEDIDVGRRVLTVGARLRLGALAHLTHSKANGVMGRSFRLGDVFGAPGRSLADRMSHASADRAVHYLSGFLDQRFSDREPDLAMQRALESARSVASLAGSLNVSLRALYNRSMETTGLSPRRLLRIVRLHRALHYAADPGKRWVEIACLAGFADQAHMVREFRALLGEAPNEWRRRSVADSFNTRALSPR